MKNYLILLFVFFFASQAFGQSEEKKDTNAAKTDSPAKKNSAPSAVNGDSLTKVNDSLTKAMFKYHVLYNAIKEKVIKHDFDPMRMSQIIDSLAARRDSTFSSLASSSAYLKDTIVALKVQILELKTQISRLTSDDEVRDRLINELKQLKILLDSGILTRTEFDLLKARVFERMR